MGTAQLILVISLVFLVFVIVIDRSCTYIKKANSTHTEQQNLMNKGALHIGKEKPVAVVSKERRGRRKGKGKKEKGKRPINVNVSMAGGQLLPTRLALVSSLLPVKVELVVTSKNQATLWKCTLVYDLALTARCRVQSSVVDHKVVPIKISLRSKT